LCGAGLLKLYLHVGLVDDGSALVWNDGVTQVDIENKGCTVRKLKCDIQLLRGIATKGDGEEIPVMSTDTFKKFSSLPCLHRSIPFFL